MLMNTPNHKIVRRSGLGGRFDLITKIELEWAKIRTVCL